jgi:putative nucleotidyltransferase with HDIG domain
MGFVEPLLAAADIEDRAGNWPQALIEYDKALFRLRSGGGPHTAAEIFRRIGKVHWASGNFDLAEEAFITCIAISEANELLDTLAGGLNSLAVVTQFTHGSQEAELLYVRALGITQQTGDARLAAMIWQNLGTLASVRGEGELALERYSAALSTYQALGDNQACGWALNNIGMVCLDLGRLQEASVQFARATSIAERAGDESLVALVHMNQVEMHIATGALVPARASCDIAAAIFWRLGARARLAEVYKWYGVLDRPLNTERAESHFSQAFELAIESGDRLLQAEIESERALLYEAADRHRDALQSLTRAAELFRDLRAGKDLEGVDRRRVKIEQAFVTVLKRWAESIEAKDKHTSGHCERVATVACALASAIGVPETELSWIYMGAFLHDVGKASVSPEILNKPGPLTAAEWELVKEHSALGASIVAQMDLPWDIRPLVRHHHEHWDGSGYPDGLIGDDIPLVARIVCVADAFDALTNIRSYQPAMSRNEALRVMELEAGVTFDPELFDTFVRLVESGAAFRTLSRTVTA